MTTTVTLAQVREALGAYEPPYEELAARFGVAAIPHLEELVRHGDTDIAARAVYLAGCLADERAAAVVALGTARPEAIVRVAAAGAAGRLGPRLGSPLLVRLLEAEDLGVRKVALWAVPEEPEPALRAKVAAMAESEVAPSLRRLAEERLRAGASSR